MSRVAVKPYLILKDEESRFRITVRTTRMNSQGYPLVSSVVLDEAFPKMAAARSYLREQYGADTTQIATK